MAGGRGSQSRARRARGPGFAWARRTSQAVSRLRAGSQPRGRWLARRRPSVRVRLTAQPRRSRPERGGRSGGPARGRGSVASAGLGDPSGSLGSAAIASRPAGPRPTPARRPGRSRCRASSAYARWRRRRGSGSRSEAGAAPLEERAAAAASDARRRRARLGRRHRAGHVGLARAPVAARRAPRHRRRAVDALQRQLAPERRSPRGLRPVAATRPRPARTPRRRGSRARSSRDAAPPRRASARYPLAQPAARPRRRARARLEEARRGVEHRSTSAGSRRSRRARRCPLRSACGRVARSGRPPGPCAARPSAGRGRPTRPPRCPRPGSRCSATLARMRRSISAADVRVLAQELLGRLAALAEPRVAEGEPRAGLGDDVHRHADVEEAALAGDPLAVHDVELGDAERAARPCS